MVSSQPDRIWLVPQKFWSATKEMSAEETDKLMEQVVNLSEAHDVESLRKFDFIVVQKPDRAA